jgi:hypothetical protein
MKLDRLVDSDRQGIAIIEREIALNELRIEISSNRSSIYGALGIVAVMCALARFDDDGALAIAVVAFVSGCASSTIMGSLRAIADARAKMRSLLPPVAELRS